MPVRRGASDAALGDQTVDDGLGFIAARGVAVQLGALGFAEAAGGGSLALQGFDLGVQIADQILGVPQLLLFGGAEAGRLGAARRGARGATGGTTTRQNLSVRGDGNGDHGRREGESQGGDDGVFHCVVSGERRFTLFLDYRFVI